MSVFRITLAVNVDWLKLGTTHQQVSERDFPIVFQHLIKVNEQHVFLAKVKVAAA